MSSPTTTPPATTPDASTPSRTAPSTKQTPSPKPRMAPLPNLVKNIHLGPDCVTVFSGRPGEWAKFRENNRLKAAREKYAPNMEYLASLPERQRFGLLRIVTDVVYKKPHEVGWDEFPNWMAGVTFIGSHKRLGNPATLKAEECRKKKIPIPDDLDYSIPMSDNAAIALNNRLKDGHDGELKFWQDINTKAFSELRLRAAERADKSKPLPDYLLKDLFRNKHYHEDFIYDVDRTPYEYATFPDGTSYFDKDHGAGVKKGPPPKKVKSGLSQSVKFEDTTDSDYEDYSSGEEELVKKIAKEVADMAIKEKVKDPVIPNVDKDADVAETDENGEPVFKPMHLWMQGELQIWNKPVSMWRGDELDAIARGKEYLKAHPETKRPFYRKPAWDMYNDPSCMPDFKDFPMTPLEIRQRHAQERQDYFAAAETAASSSSVEAATSKVTDTVSGAVEVAKEVAAAITDKLPSAETVATTVSDTAKVAKEAATSAVEKLPSADTVTQTVSSAVEVVRDVASIAAQTITAIEGDSVVASTEKPIATSTEEVSASAASGDEKIPAAEVFKTEASDIEDA